jgi:hypothetical protein
MVAPGDRPVVDLRWAPDPSGASDRLRSAAASGDTGALRTLVDEGVPGADAVAALVAGDGEAIDRLVTGPSVIPRRLPLDLDIGLTDDLRLVVPFGDDGLAIAGAIVVAAAGRGDAALEQLGRLPSTTAAALAQAVILDASGAATPVTAQGEIDVFDDITAVLAVLGAVALREAHREREALVVLDGVLRRDGLSRAVGRIARLERARARVATGDGAGARDDLEQLLAQDGRDVAARESLAGLRTTEPSQAGDAAPEQQELAVRESALHSLEAELVEAEVALATLEAELEAFAATHQDALGERYILLDRLIAEEARLRAAEGDPRARMIADAAARRAAATEDSVKEERDRGNGRVAPTDDIKKLYRRLARRLHPDLARDEDDRAQRERLMAEANDAYRRGDVDTLSRLASEWADRPEAVAGEDVGARLVRAIRAMATVRARLEHVVDAYETLLASPLANLQRQVADAAAHGHDLLAEMGADLDAEIADVESRLAEIRPHDVPDERATSRRRRS